MGPLFFSKWFCPALVLLAVVVVVLIGNSFALECYGKCSDTKGTNCKVVDCGLGSFVCHTLYSEGNKTKHCFPSDVMTAILDSTDTCKDLTGEEYFRKFASYNYNLIKNSAQAAATLGGLTEEQFIQQNIDRKKANPNEAEGLKTTIKYCACSEDKCNDEAYDKKNVNNANGNTAALNNAGCHITVIFLALATVVSCRRRIHLDS